MKRYELKFIKGGKGVFKVSVVKDPAIDSTLVHFSAEKEEKQTFTDEEKKVIYSVVMRPNMDIFRKNVKGEPANVFYTPETVEEAQVNYFRNNGNSATNINHSDLADADGIFPFESWIVADAKTDRAVNFGLDVQNGDWVMGMKVDNNELWNEHLKTGKLDGFSVEATNINYVETMSKDKKEKGTTLIQKFKKLLFEEEIAEVSKWWNTVTNTTFEVGEIVMRKGYEEGDEPFPVSSGEYELEDGRRILTDSEGVIRFIFPAAGADDADSADDAADTADAADDKADDKEEMASEDDKDKEDKEDAADAAADAADDAADDSAEDSKDDKDDEEEETLESVKAENVELKAQIATLKAEAVKASADLEKMSKQTPAANKIKNLPDADVLEMKAENYDKMTNVQKMKFNRDNKRQY